MFIHDLSSPLASIIEPDLELSQSPNMVSLNDGKMVNPNANHNMEILSLTIAFVALSFVSLAARLASRRMKHAKLGIDDWFLIVAWVCGFLIQQV